MTEEIEVDKDAHVQSVDGVVIIHHTRVDSEYWEVRGPRESQRAETPHLGDVQQMIEDWGEPDE